MPYIHELDMTTVQESRQHALLAEDHSPNTQTERHWLLDSVYGRDLLKEKLRSLRPDLKIPRWRMAWELDDLLDEMIDELGLRHWPRPRTWLGIILYIKFALMTGLEIAVKLHEL